MAQIRSRHMERRFRASHLFLSDGGTLLFRLGVLFEVAGGVYTYGVVSDDTYLPDELEGIGREG